MNALFIDEASFLYTDYLSKMISEPSSEILALTNKYINEDVPTDFEEIWKNIFVKIDSSNIEKLYNKLLSESNSIQEFENFISVLDSKWPDTNMIWTALGFARHFKEKLTAPTTNNELYAKIELIPEDTNVKGSLGLILRMPIEFKPFMIGENNVFFHPDRRHVELSMYHCQPLIHRL